MNVENQVLVYLKGNFEASPKDITEVLGVSKQIVHRVLAKLIERGEIEKIGRSPKVYYSLIDKPLSYTTKAEDISDIERGFLDDHFNLFTEKGNEINGAAAFEKWCGKQKLPFAKTVKEYIKTREKYLAYFEKNKLIDGTEKLINTKAFSRICVDKMYYGDFYAIERFGKTKLGNIIHFAKQGQNKPLMEKMCVLLKPLLEKLIEQNNIEAVGYIPPTIKRDVQLMNYMKRSLNLPLPHINLKKVTGIIPIPQKALAKIEERISNAKASIVVDDKRIFKTILLIDDAVGSGATINETACKLKMKKIAGKVLGLSVVGSFKGFDVIQEV